MIRSLSSSCVRCLATRGTQFASTPTGAAAWPRSALSPTEVLRDLNLPSMTGLDVLARIRQHLGPELPIVLMTASTQRWNWVAQGATAFLATPFDKDER